MTKGEKYRAYYLKNRERILEANRERGRAYRERMREETDDDIITEQREKQRETYIKRKSANVKNILLTHAEGDTTGFFATLANAPDLHTVSRRQLEWLLRCVPEAQNIPTLVIEEIDGSDIPYTTD
jgi:mRNA degradation ribonuclease J1/J2